MSSKLWRYHLWSNIAASSFKARTHPNTLNSSEESCLQAFEQARTDMSISSLKTQNLSWETETCSMSLKTIGFTQTFCTYDSVKLLLQQFSLIGL